jgi:hypothetical protein
MSNVRLHGVGMTWNYRVVRTAEGVSVFEIFYDEAGRPTGSAERPTLNFFCETEGGVLSELEVIRGAFELPTLSSSDIEGEK